MYLYICPTSSPHILSRALVRLLSPHTEVTHIKFNTVLHAVTSLSLPDLTFQEQYTHKDVLPPSDIGSISLPLSYC